MELFIILFLFFLIISITIFLYDYFNKSNSIIINNNQNNEIEKLYESKKFMTEYELDFYNKIKELETEYKIVPQINLATIIKKRKFGYVNELFRNIDFGIFDKEYNKLLLLIEINDKTHNMYNRKKRDNKVHLICKQANIRLITFHTNYPNKKEYVISRIKENLNH